MLVLPHLIKICEICEKREQFKWIKDTMLLLQEKVPMEDSISHQVSDIFFAILFFILIFQIGFGLSTRTSYNLITIAQTNFPNNLFSSCTYTEYVKGEKRQKFLLKKFVDLLL